MPTQELSKSYKVDIALAYVYTMVDSILCCFRKYAGLVCTGTAQNRRHLSTRIQSSLLFVDFRFGSILRSHYSRKCQKKPIRHVTIHFQDRSSAASLRHKKRSEIGVLCVNESPIRYVFGAGTRAMQYRVDMA